MDEEQETSPLGDSRNFNTLTNIFNNKKLSDCSFVIHSDGEQKLFSAHKLLLTTTCPAFEMYLSNPEPSDGPIVIDTIKPDVFEQFLRFVYDQAIEFSTIKQSIDVYELSDSLKLPALKAICVEFILRNAELPDVWPVLQCGVSYEDKVLIEPMMQIVQQRTNELLECSEMEDVSLPVLELLLDQESLNIDSELQIYNAVVRWCSKECGRRGMDPDRNNQRMVLGEGIRKIRFLTLQSEEMQPFTDQNGLLTDKELNGIYSSIMTGVGKPDAQICKLETERGKPANQAFLGFKVEEIAAMFPDVGTPFHQSRRGSQEIEEQFTASEDGQIETVTLPNQEVKFQALLELRPGKDVSTYEETLILSLKKNHATVQIWFPTYERCRWGSESRSRLSDPLKFSAGDIITVTVELIKFGWYPLEKPSQNRFRSFYDKMPNNFFFVRGLE